MNAPENFSSRILPTSSQEPHPHYKRVVAIIAAVIVVGLLILFVCLYFSDKGRGSDRALRAEYAREQKEALKAVFKNFDQNATSSENDKKQLEGMFSGMSATSSGSSSDAQALKTWFETQDQQSEQVYSEWKATRQN